MFQDAEKFASLIKQLYENKVWENLLRKHQNYIRNLNGIIEHIHYYPKQIVMITQIIVQQETR